MPTWYRLWITSIHDSFAVNCSRPVWSKLKSARIPIPTARLASDAISAVTLAASSSAFGRSSTTAMPTSGMNTARVSAQSSNQSIAVRPLRLGDVDDVDGEREQRHPGEQDQRVTLHAARLDLADLATGQTGLDGDAVDRAVDDPLVEDVVGRRGRA